MFPNRNTRFIKVKGSLCRGGPLTGRVFRGTGRVLNFHVASLVFTKASRSLHRAGIARPTVFLRSIVLTGALNSRFGPSVATKRSLKRFSTLITTKTLSFRSKLILMSGHTVTVRGTYRTAPSAVTTILTLPSRGMRRVYTDVRNRIIMYTGCGYPKRLIVSNSMPNVSTTYRGVLTTNTGHTLGLGINNTFRSPLVRPTHTRLTTTVRTAPVRGPSYPICRGMDAGNRAYPRAVGAGLVTRLATPIH